MHTNAARAQVDVPTLCPPVEPDPVPDDDLAPPPPPTAADEAETNRRLWAQAYAGAHRP